MISGPFTSPSIPHKTDLQPEPLGAETVASPAFTHRLATPALKYLEGRGLLLGIEAQEVLQQIVTVIAWLAMGAIAAFAGWLLLATSLVGALSMHLGWSWMKATAIVGAAHVLITLTAALVTLSRLTTAHWFADSLNELKKDRAWLKSQTTKN
jgi:uncharacterized membrane protein YqjE